MIEKELQIKELLEQARRKSPRAFTSLPQLPRASAAIEVWLHIGAGDSHRGFHSAVLALMMNSIWDDSSELNGFSSFLDD